MSNTKWRRETLTSNFDRVEIGSTNRKWLLDEGKDFPAEAARVSRIMEMFPSRSARNLISKSIRARSKDDPSTDCAITRAIGPREQRSAFCFARETGIMVETISPEALRNRAADYACQYGAFRKFGDYSFPREMACFLDTHRKLEAKVVDLSLEPAPEAALFIPPAGAIELGVCSSSVTPPKPIASPDPHFPGGTRERGSMVTLRILIDGHGKPQDVKVTRSGGKPFDEEAVRTVRNWRFKPAMCNGEPIAAAQINVELKCQLPELQRECALSSLRRERLYV